MTNTSLATVRVEIFPDYFIVWHGQRPTTVPYGQHDLLEAVILCRHGEMGNADYGAGKAPPMRENSAAPIHAAARHGAPMGKKSAHAATTPATAIPSGPPPIRTHLSLAQLQARAKNGTAKLPTPLPTKPAPAFIAGSDRPFTPDF